jgi:hypothetical protein
MQFVQRPGRRIGRRKTAGRNGGRRELGEPEIQNLGMPALGNKDVRRFNVAVHYALRMSRIQGVGDFAAQG